MSVQDYGTILLTYKDGHKPDCASRQRECTCGFDIAAGQLGGMEDRDARFEEYLEAGSHDFAKAVARTWRNIALKHRHVEEMVK